jgi:hypothetical protein
VIHCCADLNVELNNYLNHFVKKNEELGAVFINKKNEVS